MPLKFHELCRCNWVRENNGVIQASFTPGRESTNSTDPILTNTPRENGVPEVGEIYLITLQPAFPH